MTVPCGQPRRPGWPVFFHVLQAHHITAAVLLCRQYLLVISMQSLMSTMAQKMCAAVHPRELLLGMQTADRQRRCQACPRMMRHLLLTSTAGITSRSSAVAPSTIEPKS